MPVSAVDVLGVVIDVSVVVICGVVVVVGAEICLVVD